jgi:hypothetical protein
MGKYDDIINLPHHISTRHPRMSIEQRSAQFAPFAALTGYEDAVNETGRLTSKKIQLSEDEKARLDRKLQEIEKNLNEEPSVFITYFIPDTLKEGGSYNTINCNIKKIDNINRIIMLSDKSIINFDDVIEIELDKN